MSKKEKRPTRRQYFWERYLPENDPDTVHYLSPLALANFKHRVQKFTYSFNGIELVIERGVADGIYRSTREYIRNMKIAMQEAKLKHLKRDPAIRRFLKQPLVKHKLPARLFNTLKDQKCNCMEDVANKWHTELSNGQKLGAISLRLLITLFDKHGCLILCL